MPRAGSVNDSSFSSPRTPKAPWTLPSRMRRPCVSMMRDAAAPDGAARASGGGGRRGLGRFLVQVADLVGQLRALRNPMVDAGGVQHHALLGALGDGVVVAHALDVAAVPRAARVGDDDVVEGALLGAAAGEADLDHGGFSCSPVARMAR